MADAIQLAVASGPEEASVRAAAALAAAARDLQHLGPAGKVAERDRGGNSKVTRLAGISVMFP